LPPEILWKNLRRIATTGKNAKMTVEKRLPVLTTIIFLQITTQKESLIKNLIDLMFNLKI
jgi:hypothetical protein